MSYKYEDFRYDYNEDDDYFDFEDELAFVHTLDGAFAGNTEYMRVLADIYSSDMHGVKRDYNKSMFWLSKLAELGNIYATVQLGDMFMEYEKEGVPNDFKKALQLYKIAAKAGNDRATARLGIMLFYGIGHEKDTARARKFLECAAEKDEKEACFYLARILKSEGSDDWFKYLKTAAEKSNGRACWVMATKFADEISDLEFIRYLSCAANYYSFDFEPMKAQLMLADCFYNGTRMRKSAEAAKSYYKMAAEEGSQEAKDKLKKYFKIG